MEISISDATSADAEAIAVINLASWEAAYRGIVADAFLDHPDLEGRVQRWRERIAADPNPVLVAVSGDRLLGYASLVIPARDADVDDSTGGEVAAIYVSPTSFRRGIGAALIASSLERMRDRGLRDAVLWVLTENARARAFYARQGFGPDGAVRWIDGLEAEELRMRRAL